MAKQKSAVSKTLSAARDALREYFDRLNEVEELFIEFENLLESEDISASDRKRLRAELRLFRQLLVAGPRHPMVQKFEKRFRPAAQRKLPMRSFQDLKASELQQKELAKKYDRGGRKDLARKASRRAEKARRDAEIALKQGR